MFDMTKIDHATSTVALDDALNAIIHEAGRTLDASDTYQESLEYWNQFSGPDAVIIQKALRKAIKRWYEIEA